MKEPQIPLPILKEPAAGTRYWRSLEEQAQGANSLMHLEPEFPTKALWDTDISRRDFLKIMTASMAMAAFTGCRKPIEKIFPHNQNPEYQTPGQSLFFATALPMGGYGRGVLVASYEGRPIKIEGNEKHPDSLGATDAITQAMLLSLYDADRSRAIYHQGVVSTWDAFQRAMQREMGAQKAKGGAGLRILTETITSPTLAAQLEKLLSLYPEARWHTYEPVSRDAERSGVQMAFGRAVDPHYRFEQADIILSLDADFMNDGPAAVRAMRDFMGRRRVSGDSPAMNRLYVVEPTPSVTGFNADHRLPMKASAMEDFTRALAMELGASVAPGATAFSSETRKWIAAVAQDLIRAGSRALIVPGQSQSAAVHAMAYALNARLGTTGTTIYYTDPIQVSPEDQTASLAELTQAMNAGKVDVLLTLGANPVFTAPVDLAYADALSKVPTRVHHGLYQDETSELSHWHVPEAHPLESWGDLRASDGTVTLQQPIIEPLYGGKTAAEILSVLVDEMPLNAHDLVQDQWAGRWVNSVHDGLIPGTASRPVNVFLRGDWASALPTPPAAAEGYEIVFRADPTIGDGRFANNSWLQELPKPVTKLTWDNAAYVSPATAKKLDVSNEQLVELSLNGRKVKAPVWILPGQAEDTVTVHLGYGRTHAGQVGNGHGFDAYALRTRKALSWAGSLGITRVWGKRKLACTQHHASMENRNLIREATLTDFLKHPDFAHQGVHDPKPEETLYPPAPQDENYAWGMTIDLNACTGCNACVVGCQSENNIPAVGKEQVSKGREMHWIRIDRYFGGDPENPTAAFQPVNCMHCENAPCEPVCPVGATVHSDEGLNEMVYNRCVGTRYCSNNCPYKVRRFNFLQYTDYTSELAKLMNNPDVTVRMRGVMEKCTYCVQRIQHAKLDANKENRLVRDGEIVTACQAACPTSAIVFGNLKDPKSRVSRAKSDPRNYGLLTDLGTRPRTTYLARIRNPNPDLS